MRRGNAGYIGIRRVPTVQSAVGVWTLREVAWARKDNIWPFIVGVGTYDDTHDA